MGPFGALYLTQLRIQATRARLLSLAALGAAGLGIAALVGRQNTTLAAGAEFVAVFGLAVLLPITALVVSSAGFGDTIDDGTLVYLWMRPVARWQLALAALLAALTIATPLTVLPAALVPVVMGSPSTLVLPALSAATIGLIAYCCIFLALGLRSKRALMWGLLYIFIWEGFVAQAGGNSARLAVRAYTQAVLTNATGVAFDLTTIDPPWSWGVPLAVAAVAFAYTVRRLGHHDIP